MIRPQDETELLSRPHQAGANRGKGNLPPVAQAVNRVLHHGAPPNSSQTAKRFASRLARLYTLLRLARLEVNNGKHRVNECQTGQTEARFCVVSIFKAQKSPAPDMRMPPQKPDWPGGAVNTKAGTSEPSVWIKQTTQRNCPFQWAPGPDQQ